MHGVDVRVVHAANEPVSPPRSVADKAQTDDVSADLREPISAARAGLEKRLDLLLQGSRGLRRCTDGGRERENDSRVRWRRGFGEQFQTFQKPGCDPVEPQPEPGDGRAA